jgi:hypothetical protein
VPKEGIGCLSENGKNQKVREEGGLTLSIATRCGRPRRDDFVEEMNNCMCKSRGVEIKDRSDEAMTQL